MKFIKLQQDILKQAEKKLDGKRNTLLGVNYIITSDCTEIMLDAHALYCIPNCLMYLDIAKITDKIQLSKSFKKTFLDGYEFKQATLLPDRKITQDKRTLAYLTDTDMHTRVAVNTDMFKYLDLTDSTFYITSTTGPVAVYERNLLVAILMPVKER